MQKKYIYTVLAFIILFTFFFTTGMLKEGYPTGGDNVGHYDLLLNTIDALELFFKTGELHFWNSDYYFGFPMFFFYAPLPYIALALITIITGIDALTLFKWSIVLLFSLLPLIFYCCSKIMNFEDEFALGVALFSTTLSSVTVFGLEYYAFFATGLYAQLWGILFLPFATAYSYRYFVLGKGNAFLPVLFLYLTFISHLFAGIIACTLAGVLVLCSLIQEDRKKTLKKAATVFCFFAVSTAFFTIPYLLNTQYFGNIPFDMSFKEEGYGIIDTLDYILEGQMLDYSFSFSRLPFLTLLAGIGFLLSIFWNEFREKHKTLTLFLAISLFLSIILIAGKHSFAFLQYIPIFSTLQTFRFISLFHLIALFYIGIAIYGVITLTERWSKHKILPVFIILFIITTPVLYERMQSFKEYAYTYDFKEDTEYWNVIQGIQKSTTTGRTYITSQTGLFEKPQHLTAIPFLTETGIFASTGIGGHDSLNAYYTSFFLPIDLANLFNVAYIIDLKNNELTLYRTPVPEGYFGLYDAPFSLDTSPLKARDSVMTWLLSNASKEGYFMKIGEQDGIRFTNVQDNTLLAVREQNYAFDHRLFGEINLENTPTVTVITDESTTEDSLFTYLEHYATTHEPKSCGTILSGTYSRGEYETTVSAQKECYVIFKMTYHPEWHVYTDGIEQDIIMMSPAFMGVAVTPGIHDIRFIHTISSYRILLFIVGIISLITLIFWKK